MRSRFATLFLLKSQKSGEGGRRTGGVGEGLRPPSLFVFWPRRPADFFAGELRKKFRKPCGSNPPIDPQAILPSEPQDYSNIESRWLEAAHFRFHGGYWRSCAHTRMSPRIPPSRSSRQGCALDIPMCAWCERRLMREAEVGRFSTGRVVKEIQKSLRLKSTN